MNKPSRLAIRLLRSFCPPHLLEELEGDLLQKFERDMKTFGEKKAKRRLVWNVIRFIRPGIVLRNKRSTTVNQFNMLQNHFKIAFRSLYKRKGYAIINIMGLAVGITSCILIGLFVHDELSYDKDFKNGDRISKIILDRKYPDHHSVTRFIPHSFATTVVKDYPEVERATTITGPFDNMMISYKGDQGAAVTFLEKDVYAADSNLFKIFSFNIKKGDRNTMLLKPKSMVLTESTARRHFGDKDPLGKIITMSGDNFIVTGVCEDPPQNTHFKFGLIISIQTIERFNLDNFERPDTHCYIQLKPETDAVALQGKFHQMVDTYAAPEIEKVNKVSWLDYKKAGNGYTYSLLPLTEVYLNPLDIGGMKPGGNILSVKIVMGIAGLIFLIACINFMNLTTARSTERAKEVGIRKVMGSFRRQLVFQFLTESTLLTLIGVSLAVAASIWLLPKFNTLVGKNLQIDLNGSVVACLLAAVIVLGFLAGIYPALVLSSFNPMKALKGNFVSSTSGKNIRKGLVVVQFSISISLIICTTVMVQQMQFIRDKDLGYGKEQLLDIEGDFHMKPKFTKRFIEEIKRLPQVIAAAGSLSMPSIGGIYPQQYRAEGSPEVETLRTMYAGDGFCELMGFELVEGKLFSDLTNDSLSVILNESAVKQLDIKNPLGKKISFIEQTYGSGEQTTFTIVGVVKDFNYESLHKEIRPIVIQSNEIIFSRVEYIAVRLQPASIHEAITQLESKWKELSPESPFQFRFVDDVLNDLYQKEERTWRVFIVFSGLCIFIACIGLLGLSAFTISLRTKEIGIRKVVGAGLRQIVILISRDFTVLIFVSFLLAVPVAWYVMESWWLKGFAYRVHISVLTMTLCGLATLLMTWIVISYQTLKVAKVNPIESLKAE
jgi:putative ABC transport system permease protein